MNGFFMKAVTNSLWKRHRYFNRRSRILYSVGVPAWRGVEMVIMGIFRAKFCWKMYTQFIFISTCILSKPVSEK